MRTMTVQMIIVFHGDGGVDKAKQTMAPSPSATTPRSQSFRERIAVLRVRQRIGTSLTVQLASAVTIWCMRDGWRHSKRQSSTRTSSPCLPTRRSAARRVRVWEGLRLVSPHPLYLTLDSSKVVCFALYTIFPSHSHTPSQLSPSSTLQILAFSSVVVSVSTLC
jgi:hypothetical protein